MKPACSRPRSNWMGQNRISTVMSLSLVAIAALIFVWMIMRFGELELHSLDVVVSPRTPSDDPCSYPQPTDRDLDETEAVAAAECFVIQNGYTDLPPTADKSKIIPENVYPMNDEAGLKARHDSLEPRAVTVLRDADSWDGSWIIMFRVKGQNSARYPLPKTSGRAVVMDLYGRDIRIQHSNYPMKMPGARVISP